MMKLSKGLMLSVSGLLFMSCGSMAHAHISTHNLTSFNSPDEIISVYTHFTHTTHLNENSLLSSLELNSPPKDFSIYTLPKDLGRVREGFNHSTLTPPLSLKGEGRKEGRSENEVKLAGVCFLTDVSECSRNEFMFNGPDAPSGSGGGSPDDWDIDNEERCRKEGYTLTTCPSGQEASGFCPYDNKYFEKCIDACPDGYVTCIPPYHGVGEACGNKYTSCECTPCGIGYDKTAIPDGFVQDGEPCIDCDGITKYKVKANPCDGFLDCGNMGGATDAETCLSGSKTMYDNCNPCPNLGEYETCPSCTVCEYEECSGLWYGIGCEIDCADYCDFCGG